MSDVQSIAAGSDKASPGWLRGQRFDLFFVVRQPGTALLEVSNRGGKASLSYFNGGRSATDPTSDGHFGDGFLMRRGLTVIWVGWQFDVPEGSGRLRLDVPYADLSPTITGLVRSDWTVDRPVDTLAVGHRNHRAYPVADPGHSDNVLTVRSGRNATREVVPRKNWHFARVVDGKRVEGPNAHHDEWGIQRRQDLRVGLSGRATCNRWSRAGGDPRHDLLRQARRQLPVSSRTWPCSGYLTDGEVSSPLPLPRFQHR